MLLPKLWVFGVKLWFSPFLRWGRHLCQLSAALPPSHPIYADTTHSHPHTDVFLTVFPCGKGKYSKMEGIPPERHGMDYTSLAHKILMTKKCRRLINFRILMPEPFSLLSWSRSLDVLEDNLPKWNNLHFSVRWIHPECCSFSNFPVSLNSIHVFMHRSDLLDRKSA